MLLSLLKKFLTFLSCFAIAAQPILAEGIKGGGGRSPDVAKTANGVPLVLIVAPDANGVSHNTFDSFDVGPNGAIINNSGDAYTETLLGGTVMGNPNLGGGTASLIIGEVVTNNPSELNGYLEIAGDTADLIIANPYGITCNGCGFINTDHTALTTGKPKYVNGRFQELSVNTGAIKVGRGGLDARGTTQFDLIARKVVFDGAVVGERVRVIAGRNDVVFATGAARAKRPNGSTAPAYAIDSTVFGGMYANKIAIQSTEKGVGVRAPKRMSAGTGGMRITADGKLVIGEAYSTGKANIQAERVVVEKKLHVQKALSVAAKERIIAEADATIVSQASASLKGGEAVSLRDRAQLYAKEGVFAAAGGFVYMGEGARIQSWRNVSLWGENAYLKPNALIVAGADAVVSNVKLRFSDGMYGQSIRVFATGSLSFDADRIVIDQNSDLPASKFAAQDSVKLNGTNLRLGKVQISGDSIEITAGGLAYVGSGAKLTAENGLAIQASELHVIGSVLTSGADLGLQASEKMIVSNSAVGSEAELIVSGGDMSIAQSELSANERLSLNGDRVGLVGTKISSAGDINLSATGAFSAVEGTEFDAEGHAQFIARSATLFSSSIAAKGPVQIGTVLGTSVDGGTVYSEQDLKLVSGGRIAVAGGSKISALSTLSLSSDSIQIEGSSIASRAALSLSAISSADFAGSEISSPGQVSLTATDIMMGNTDLSASVMTLTGASLDMSASKAVAKNALTAMLDGALKLTNNSLLGAGGRVEISAGTIGSTDSALKSDTELSVTAANSASFANSLIRGEVLTEISAPNLTLVNSELVGPNALLIQASDLSATNSKIIAGSDLTLVQSGTLKLAENSVISADGALDISVDGLDVQNSTIVSSGDLSATVANLASLNFADIASGASIDISADSLTAVGGKYQAGGDLTLSATGDLSNGADFLAYGALKMTAGDALTNSGNGLAPRPQTDEDPIFADVASLSFSGRSVTNSGNILVAGIADILAGAGGAVMSGAIEAGDAISIVSGGSLTNSGLLLTASDLTINAGAFTNSGSAQSVGATSVNVSAFTQTETGLIAATQNLLLTVAGASKIAGVLSSALGSLTLTSKSADISGALFAETGMSISTQDALITRQSHFAGTSTLFTNASMTLNAGSMILGGSVVALDQMDITSTKGMIKVTGNVGANHDVTVVSASDFLMTSGTSLRSVGEGFDQDGTSLDDGIANSNLAVTAAGALTTNGTVIGLDSVTLNGRSATLRGAIKTAGDLDVDATSGNLVSSAAIVAGISYLDASGAMSLGGDIDGSLVATAGGALTVTGQLDGLYAASLTGALMTIGSAAKISTVDNLALTTTGGALTNRAEITAGADLGIYSSGSVNNYGTLAAAKTLSITSGGLLNASGAILDGKGMTLLDIAGNASNHGKILASSLLSAEVSGKLTNTGLIQTRAGNVQVKAASVRNSGEIRAKAKTIDGQVNGGTVFLTNMSAFDNTGGKIFADVGISMEMSQALPLGASWGNVVSNQWLSVTGINDGYLPAIKLASGQRIVNRGAIILKTAGLVNDGLIASKNGGVTLKVKNNVTNRGLIYAGADTLSIQTAGNIINDGGVLLSSQNILLMGAAAANGSLTFSGGQYYRAASIQNVNGGVIETFNGDIVMSSKEIINKRKLTMTTSVFEDKSDNVTNRANWGLCTETDCTYGNEGSIARTLTPGSTLPSSTSPYNWQMRHVVTDVTPTNVGQESMIVSGRDIYFQGGKLVNEYGLISANRNIDFDMNSVNNVGARSGTEVRWSLSFIAGSDDNSDGTYKADDEPILTFQRAFGIKPSSEVTVDFFGVTTFQQHNPDATYDDFDPRGGSVGKLLPGETLTPNSPTAMVALRIDNEIGIKTPTGRFLRFSDMPRYEASGNPYVNGWLTGTFTMNAQDVREWGGFNTAPIFYPGTDVFGTIEAGGAITGTITGTTNNWAVGANKSDIFGTGGGRPSIDPRVPAGSAGGGATIGGSNVNSFGGASSYSRSSVAGTQAEALVLEPLSTATIKGWGKQAGVKVNFSKVVGRVDFEAFTNDRLFKISAVKYNPGKGQFLMKPGKVGKYLIETRHSFIKDESFANSDYLVSQLGGGLDRLTRFGDAMAETYLIRDQIYDLTGRRLLPGFAGEVKDAQKALDDATPDGANAPTVNAEAVQIEAMYDNAVDAQEKLGLTPGVALSPRQIARLKEDIIWLEKRVISGVEVLVPQVYLAGSAGLATKTSGAQITGGAIGLNTKKFFNDGGDVTARGPLTIVADKSIANEFGDIRAGGALNLISDKGDVSLLSGTIMGGSVTLKGRNVKIETFSEDVGDKFAYRTNVGKIATVKSAGSLSLIADNSISVVGSELLGGMRDSDDENVSLDVSLFAGGDISVGSVKTASGVKGGDQKNGFETSRTGNVNSTISSEYGGVSIVSAKTRKIRDEDGNVVLDENGQPVYELVGGGDIELMGTSITALDEANIEAKAGQVTLGAVLDTRYSQFRSYKKSGLFGSKKKSTFSERLSATWTRSTIRAGSINVTAAGNVIAQAAGLFARSGQETVRSLYADVHSSSVTDIHATHSITKTSRFWGLMDWSTEVKTLKAKAKSVEAKAAEGINISGRNVIIEGGTFDPGNGKVKIEAENVYLLATVDTDYTEVIEHSNNGFLVVDEHTVDATQTANFTKIEGGKGKLDVGDAKVTLGLQSTQAALVYAAPSLLAPENEDATAMALVDYYLQPSQAPPGVATDPIYDAVADALKPEPGQDTEQEEASPNEALDALCDEGGLSGDSATATSDTICAALDGAEPEAEPSPYGFSDSTYDVGIPTGAGFEYLDELFASDQLTVQDMELVNHHFYDKTVQLGTLGQLLLTYVTGQIMGAGFLSGAVDGLATALGPVLGEAAGAVAQSMVQSMVTSTMTGVVTGEFDLGATLTSAFTAGIGAWAGSVDFAEVLGLGEGAAVGWLAEGGQLTTGAVVDTLADSIITAGVTSILTDQDFFDALTSSFTSGVLSLATADIQGLIGDQFAEGQNGGEGSLGHVLSHGVLGCVMGELQGSTCAAGAAAGAASAIMAGIVDKKGLSVEDATALTDEAHLIAGIAAAFTGADTGQVMTAAGIGQSAYENNYLTHLQVNEMVAALEACGDDESCRAEVFDQYRAISDAQDQELADCTTQACVEEHLAAAQLGMIAYANLSLETKQGLGLTLNISDAIAPDRDVVASLGHLYDDAEDAVAADMAETRAGYADLYCDSLTSSECDSLTLELYKAAHIDPKLQEMALDIATAGMAECFKAGGDQASCQMNAAQVVLDLSKSIVGGAAELVYKSLTDPAIREYMYEFIADETGNLKLPWSGATNKGTGARFADQVKLDDHFIRHGADFGATSSAQYEQMADNFLTGPRGTNTLERIRPNGDVVRYDPTTDAFGVVSSNGTVRTYYVPDPAVHGYATNLDYFNAQ